MWSHLPLAQAYRLRPSYMIETPWLHHKRTLESTQALIRCWLIRAGSFVLVDEYRCFHPRWKYMMTPQFCVDEHSPPLVMEAGTDIHLV